MERTRSAPSPAAGWSDLPPELELRESSIEPGKTGLWSKGPIAIGRVYGPFLGQTVHVKPSKVTDCTIWQIRDVITRRVLHYVDASRPGRQNWMRHLKCSPFIYQKNVEPFQKGLQIYYKIIKELSPGEELITYLDESPLRIENDAQERQSAAESPQSGWNPILLIRRVKGSNPGSRKHKSSVTHQVEFKSAPPVPQTALSLVASGRKKTGSSRPESEDTKSNDLAPVDLLVQEVLGTKINVKTMVLDDYSKSSTSASNDKRSILKKPNNMPVTTKTFTRAAIASASSAAGSSKPSTATTIATRASPLPTSPSTRGPSVQGTKKGLKGRKTPAPTAPAPSSSTAPPVCPPSPPAVDHDTQEYQFHVKDRHIIESNRHGKKVYRCDICAGVYRHAFSLKRHFIRTHINYNYLSSADIANCNITLTDRTPKRILSDYELKKSGKKREWRYLDLFRCHLCHGHFSSSGELMNHINHHPDSPAQKRFACGQCDMTFSHKQNLVRHESVHSGVKPHSCRYCHKNFPSLANQRRHERIHEGLKPFDCRDCDSAFSQSGDLRKHVKKQHGDRFHPCNYCAKYFQMLDDLKAHEATHQGGVSNNQMEFSRQIPIATESGFDFSRQFPGASAFGSNNAANNSAGFNFGGNYGGENVSAPPAATLTSAKNQTIECLCTECPKKFSTFVNMCRHRRLTHHVVQGRRGKFIGSSSNGANNGIREARTGATGGIPLAADAPITESEFLMTVANRINDNLINYVDGKAFQLKYRPKRDSNTAASFSSSNGGEHSNKTPVWKAYNFPETFDMTSLTNNATDRCLPEANGESQNLSSTRGYSGSYVVRDPGSLLRQYGLKVDESCYYYNNWSSDTSSEEYDEVSTSDDDEPVRIGRDMVPVTYVCSACGESFDSNVAIEDHKINNHPNVYCTHIEIEGEKAAPPELSLQYRSPVGALRQCFVPPVIRDPLSDDGENGAASKSILTCTKCASSFEAVADLHLHILECGGDAEFVRQKTKFNATYSRRRGRPVKRQDITEPPVKPAKLRKTDESTTNADKEESAANKGTDKENHLKTTTGNYFNNKTKEIENSGVKTKETLAGIPCPSKSKENGASNKGKDNSKTSSAKDTSTKSKETSATSKSKETSATSKSKETSATSKSKETSATSKSKETSATSKSKETSATSKSKETSATSKSKETSATSKSKETSATSKSKETSATKSKETSATKSKETTASKTKEPSPKGKETRSSKDPSPKSNTVKVSETIEKLTIIRDHKMKMEELALVIPNFTLCEGCNMSLACGDEFDDHCKTCPALFKIRNDANKDDTSECNLAPAIDEAAALVATTALATSVMASPVATVPKNTCPQCMKLFSTPYNVKKHIREVCNKRLGIQLLPPTPSLVSTVIEPPKNPSPVVTPPRIPTPLPASVEVPAPLPVLEPKTNPAVPVEEIKRESSPKPKKGKKGKGKVEKGRTGKKILKVKVAAPIMLAKKQMEKESEEKAATNSVILIPENKSPNLFNVVSEADIIVPKPILTRSKVTIELDKSQPNSETVKEQPVLAAPVAIWSKLAADLSSHFPADELEVKPVLVEPETSVATSRKARKCAPRVPKFYPPVARNLFSTPQPYMILNTLANFNNSDSNTPASNESKKSAHDDNLEDDDVPLSSLRAAVSKDGKEEDFIDKWANSMERSQSLQASVKPTPTRETRSQVAKNAIKEDVVVPRPTRLIEGKSLTKDSPTVTPTLATTTKEESKDICSKNITANKSSDKKEKGGKASAAKSSGKITDITQTKVGVEKTPSKLTPVKKDHVKPLEPDCISPEDKLKLEKLARTIVLAPTVNATIPVVPNKVTRAGKSANETKSSTSKDDLSPTGKLALTEIFSANGSLVLKDCDPPTEILTSKDDVLATENSIMGKDVSTTDNSIWKSDLSPTGNLTLKDGVPPFRYSAPKDDTIVTGKLNLKQSDSSAEYSQVEDSAPSTGKENAPTASLESLTSKYVTPSTGNSTLKDNSPSTGNLTSIDDSPVIEISTPKYDALCAAKSILEDIASTDGKSTLKDGTSPVGKDDSSSTDNSTSKNFSLATANCDFKDDTPSTKRKDDTTSTNNLALKDDTTSTNNLALKDDTPSPASSMDDTPSTTSLTLKDNTPSSVSSTLKKGTPSTGSLTLKDDASSTENSTLKDDAPSTENSTLKDDAPSTENSTLKDDAPSTENSTLKDDAPSTENSTLKDDAPSTENSTLKDDVPSTEDSTLKDDAPSTGNSTLKDDAPSTEKSTLKDDAPSTGNSTLKDDAPSTEKSTLKDDAPSTGNSTLKDDAPSTGKSTLKDDAPSTEKSTLKDDAPSTENSTLKDDAPSTENSTLKDDAPSTENSTLKDDAPSTENSTLKDDAPSTENSTLKDDAPSTENSTLKDDAPSTENSTLKDDSPYTESSTLKDDAPSTESSTLKDDAPSTESSTLKDDAPSTENSSLKDDAPSTESSTLKDDTQSTENSSLKDDTQSTEISTLKDTDQSTTGNSKIEVVDPFQFVSTTPPPTPDPVACTSDSTPILAQVPIKREKRGESFDTELKSTAGKDDPDLDKSLSNHDSKEVTKRSIKRKVKIELDDSKFLPQQLHKCPQCLRKFSYLANYRKHMFDGCPLLRNKTKAKKRGCPIVVSPSVLKSQIEGLVIDLLRDQTTQSEMVKKQSTPVTKPKKTGHSKSASTTKVPQTANNNNSPDVKPSTSKLTVMSAPSKTTIPKTKTETPESMKSVKTKTKSSSGKTKNASSVSKTAKSIPVSSETVTPSKPGNPTDSTPSKVLATITKREEPIKEPITSPAVSSILTAITKKLKTAPDLMKGNTKGDTKVDSKGSMVDDIFRPNVDPKAASKDDSIVTREAKNVFTPELNQKQPNSTATTSNDESPRNKPSVSPSCSQTPSCSQQTSCSSSSGGGQTSKFSSFSCNFCHKIFLSYWKLLQHRISHKLESAPDQDSPAFKISAEDAIINDFNKLSEKQRVDHPPVYRSTSSPPQPSITKLRTNLALNFKEKQLKNRKDSKDENPDDPGHQNGTAKVRDISEIKPSISKTEPTGVRSQLYSSLSKPIPVRFDKLHDVKTYNASMLDADQIKKQAALLLKTNFGKKKSAGTKKKKKVVAIRNTDEDSVIQTPKKASIEEQIGEVAKEESSNKEPASAVPKDKTPIKEPISEVPKEKSPNNESTSEAPLEKSPIKEHISDFPKRKSPNKKKVSEVPKDNSPLKEAINDVPKEKPPNKESICKVSSEKSPSKEPISKAPSEKCLSKEHIGKFSSKEPASKVPKEAINEAPKGKSQSNEPISENSIEKSLIKKQAREVTKGNKLQSKKSISETLIDKSPGKEPISKTLIEKSPAKESVSETPIEKSPSKEPISILPKEKSTIKEVDKAVPKVKSPLNVPTNEVTKGKSPIKEVDNEVPKVKSPLNVPTNEVLKVKSRSNEPAKEISKICEVPKEKSPSKVPISKVKKGNSTRKEPVNETPKEKSLNKEPVSESPKDQPQINEPSIDVSKEMSPSKGCLNEVLKEMSKEAINKAPIDNSYGKEPNGEVENEKTSDTELIVEVKKVELANKMSMAGKVKKVTKSANKKPIGKVHKKKPRSKKSMGKVTKRPANKKAIGKVQKVNPTSKKSVSEVEKEAIPSKESMVEEIYQSKKPISEANKEISPSKPSNSEVLKEISPSKEPVSEAHEEKTPSKEPIKVQQKETSTGKEPIRQKENSPCIDPTSQVLKETSLDEESVSELKQKDTFAVYESIAEVQQEEKSSRKGSRRGTKQTLAKSKKSIKADQKSPRKESPVKELQGGIHTEMSTSKEVVTVVAKQKAFSKDVIDLVGEQKTTVKESDIAAQKKKSLGKQSVDIVQKSPINELVDVAQKKKSPGKESANLVPKSPCKEPLNNVQNEKIACQESPDKPQGETSLSIESVNAVQKQKDTTKTSLDEILKNYPISKESVDGVQTEELTSIQPSDRVKMSLRKVSPSVAKTNKPSKKGSPSQVQNEKPPCKNSLGEVTKEEAQNKKKRKSPIVKSLGGVKTKKVKLSPVLNKIKTTVTVVTNELHLPVASKRVSPRPSATQKSKEKDVKTVSDTNKIEHENNKILSLNFDQMEFEIPTVIIKTEDEATSSKSLEDLVQSDEEEIDDSIPSTCHRLDHDNLSIPLSVSVSEIFGEMNQPTDKEVVSERHRANSGMSRSSSELDVTNLDTSGCSSTLSNAILAVPSEITINRKSLLSPTRSKVNGSKTISKVVIPPTKKKAPTKAKVKVQSFAIAKIRNTAKLAKAKSVAKETRNSSSATKLKTTLKKTAKVSSQPETELEDVEVEDYEELPVDEETAGDKKCQECERVFANKLNRDRHFRLAHKKKKPKRLTIIKGSSKRKRGDDKPEVTSLGDKNESNSNVTYRAVANQQITVKKIKVESQTGRNSR